MKEVSCRATRILLETCEVSGIAPERLIDGVPVSLDYLQNPENSIDWSTLIALLENVEAICGTGRALDRMSARALRVPEFEPLRKLAGLFVLPDPLYAAAFHWLLPIIFPALDASMERLEDGRLLIVGRVPPQARDSSAFFRFCRGPTAGVSTLIGLPPAILHDEVGPHEAKYIVELPPAPPFLERLGRRVSGIFRSDAVLGALAEQQKELRAGYKALLRTRHDFRAVLETLPDLVVVHRSGQILWANRAFLACVGSSDVEAVRGRTLIDFIHPDDHAILRERAKRPGEAATRETQPPDELRLVQPDGEIVILEVPRSREVEFEGEAAWIVVARDVTERRRMLEQLMISDRLASLGMLAAGIAHEINNPLAYLSLNLERVQRDVAESAGPPDQERLAGTRMALATAREGAERMRQIVRDLLYFSRVEDGLGPVCVVEVLESTLALAESELSPRARLERDYQPVPKVRANRGRLGQVFLNLLRNAADAIPGGQPDQNVIGLRACVDASGRVVVEVSDTGRGIPREIQGRIFNPFFTTKQVGTGLGLAISRSLVARVGGEITMESIAGKGSTFRVALPACDAPEAGDFSGQLRCC